MTELKNTLWELSDQYHEMADRILLAGCLTPEMEAEFDLIGAALADKMLRCSEFRRTLLHNAAFNKEEADDRARRAKAWANGAEGMKRYMLRQLVRAEIRSLRSTDGSRLWTVRKTPGRVVVDDLSAIPDNMLKHFDPEPDLAAIRAALKAGVPIAAHLEVEDSLTES